MISKDIDIAIDLLKKDDIIGLPTETVYGLAANMTSDVGINKIFELKKRPLTNPLIVHIGKIEDLEKVAINIPPKAYELVKTYWPGPLTLILKKHEKVSKLITANQNTVAVRMPNHPMALELINKLGSPIVAPSANPYMSVSPTSAIHVLDYFGEELPLVLDGGTCERGIESTIAGFEDNCITIYRHGSITGEMIKSSTGLNVNDYEEGLSKVKTPGMHLKHYAPNTKLVLTNNIQTYISQYKAMKLAIITFKDILDTQNFENQFFLSRKGDLEEIAQNLYKQLISIDRLGFDYIIIEKMPNIGVGISINDRLKKASFKEDIYY